MSTDTEELARLITAEILEALAPVLDRDERPLISVPDAARRLGVSPKTGWNLVTRGDLPSVVIGEGRRMIEPAAIDAYIAARRG